ncbi:hypothetical protein [Nocardia sp. SC052]|uniref:hypothetical protein n=1 Tax=Nocardia sichangensis TaxID=3385975 RepID=UPI0039A1CDBF
MTVLVGLIGAVLGSIVGGIITYVTARANLRLTLEHSYDQTLQTKRLEHYQALFHTTGCLPRYWPKSNLDVTRADIRRFRESFHDWYFGEGAGGMFLTPEAKRIYMRLVTTLVETEASVRESQPADDDTVSNDEIGALRVLASDLRHQLAKDVGAAHPPRLSWTRPEPLPPQPWIEQNGQSQPAIASTLPTPPGVAPSR